MEGIHSGSADDDGTEELEEGPDTFIPSGEELKEERKPELGMHFDTLEAAQRFCNVYAYINGFGVVKGRNYKNVKITFQCNKARRTHAPENAQRKRKSSVMERTSYLMNVTVKLTNG
jgi:hypothetical protein